MKNMSKTLCCVFVVVWAASANASGVELYQLVVEGKIYEKTDSSSAKSLKIGEDVKIVINLSMEVVPKMEGFQTYGEEDYKGKSTAFMFGYPATFSTSHVYFGPQHSYGSDLEIGYDMRIGAKNPISSRILLGSNRLSSVQVSLNTKMSGLKNAEGNALERVVAAADLLGQDKGSIYRNSRIQLDWETQYGFISAQASIDKILLRGPQGEELVARSASSAPIRHRIPNQPEDWREDPSQWNAYILREDYEGIDCRSIVFSEYEKIPASKSPNLAQEEFRTGAKWVFYYHKKVEDAVIMKWSHPTKGYFCSVVKLGH